MENKRTSIIIKFQIEGIHNWPQAKEIEPKVAFLSDEHRHIFHITCKKEVNHNDRDVEIILFKRTIKSYLQSFYGWFEKVSTGGDIPIFQYCHFASMSCEMIAEELVKKFDLISCEVLEDGENGAIVESV